MPERCIVRLLCVLRLDLKHDGPLFAGHPDAFGGWVVGDPCSAESGKWGKDHNLKKQGELNLTNLSLHTAKVRANAASQQRSNSLLLRPRPRQSLLTIEDVRPIYVGVAPLQPLLQSIEHHPGLDGARLQIYPRYALRHPNVGPQLPLNKLQLRRQVMW